MNTAVATDAWENLLKAEKQKPYFRALLNQLNHAYAKGKTIYPPKSEIFNAFQWAPYGEVKVIILGQDPYHGPGQAHGLCFSVKEGTPPPPSLQNIFKELQEDLGCQTPHSGDLRAWAKQGVLLLNTTLTVEAGQAQSHARLGWEHFTDHVMQVLNEHPKAPLVFLLWGSFAQKKAALIDKARHHVLSAPHPSPLSAHRGFLGCRHFSQTNEFLKNDGKTPINWQLP